jgi:hypothetical protein
MSRREPPCRAEGTAGRCSDNSSSSAPERTLASFLFLVIIPYGNASWDQVIRYLGDHGFRERPDVRRATLR